METYETPLDPPLCMSVCMYVNALTARIIISAIQTCGTTRIAHIYNVFD